MSQNQKKTVPAMEHFSPTSTTIGRHLTFSKVCVTGGIAGITQRCAGDTPPAALVLFGNRGRKVM